MASQYTSYGSDIKISDFNSVLNSNCVYNRSEIEWYNKFNRFGCLDPYNRLNITKEYLFFVKPDLHIWEPRTTTLNPDLAKYPFFVDLHNRYPYVIQSLQRSAGGDADMKHNPFMSVLSNSIKNTLDLDDLNAEDMESATNMYGSKIMYRKHTWSGDENFDFTLEVEDTKYLEIYNLVRAYDEYERISQFGGVDPPNIDSAPVSKSGFNYNSYIQNRELHDTFGVYKFIVDEEYETIIYCAYICGVYFKNVPRSAFSDITQGDPLKYTLQFHAFSVEDDNPMILEDFNSLVLESYGGDLPGKSFPIFSTDLGRIDGSWATCPYISKVYKSSTPAEAWNGINGMNYQYKLKWRI